jgi:uncharacterized protein YggU (UPF0235/DUF167 family)
MYIHVRIKTKQKSESIIQISDLKYEVCVREEAKQNRANTRMLEILSLYFNTKKVKIVSGHHSPSKLISLEVAE